MLAAGVFVLTLAVYSLTMGPTTDFWDCGEFITTSHIVGVPHQPGTPLYVLVGRVFDIFFGNADLTEPALRTARAINFMSAFFSALAVMLIYLIIWELARRTHPDARWSAHIGGVVGALFLAFSETFWSNAIEAEVYGLSAFMLALLTWLALRWYDHRDLEGSNKLLLLIIYLAGLGVGFHLGTLLGGFGIFVLIAVSNKRELPMIDLVLMAAGLAIFIASTMFRNNALIVGALLVYMALVVLRTFQGRNFVLLGSALFFLGLTVHLMMMIRAAAVPEPFINQTDPETFDSLMSVLRREQYPKLQDGGRKAPLVWQFGYYYNYLLNQFYFLGNNGSKLAAMSSVLGPFLLAAVGLVQGFRRLMPLILLPLVNYLMNGEVLTLVLNFSDHEVRERDYFYFAAFLFFAIFIGLGASSLLRFAVGTEGKSAAAIQKLGGNWRKGLTQVPFTPMAKVTAIVLILIALMQANPLEQKFFEHDRSENRISYEYAWNILAGLDENAIIFTNGDNDTFPIWYLQAVEKFRTDVTVVNLSLVNLPWYIKQLKRGDPALDITRTNEEIDGLRHRRMIDPDTGEEVILMIKDFVVHDIITTNYENQRRPVFFAVTIPSDNMIRYFANLQMEGMAYRLLDKTSPTGDPVTDPEKVIENMLGVYSMDAVMDGDSERRRASLNAFRGQSTDTGELILGLEGGPLDVAQLKTLKDMLGETRTDVYRGANASHLFGNYPAALNRAGYEFFMKAQRVADTDTMAYSRYLKKAILTFEACLKISPWNEQTMDLYPLLLVQDYRDQEAKDFLTSLSGNVPIATEERIVYSTLSGLVRGGVNALAQEWLAERMADQPDRLFYYQVQFSLYQNMGRLREAAQVADAWQHQSGQRDEAMDAGLAEMRKKEINSEKDRVRKIVGDKNEQK
jgi:Protein O-mannosyl-transferase TMEM260-like